MFAVSLICLTTLLTWMALLSLNNISRRHFRTHLRRSAIAIIMLTLMGVAFPVQQGWRWHRSQQAIQEEARHTIVLKKARTIAGMTMPAGTLLRLQIPSQLETFERATFPKPITVAGISVIRLERYLTEKKTNPNNYYATSVSAIITRDETIAGWRCSHRHKVAFTVINNVLRFNSCHLAANNDLNGQRLPAGTWVSLRHGTQRALDPRHADGWLLYTEGKTVSSIARMPLLKAELQLDWQRHLVGLEGRLSQDFTLGTITYPPGTTVMSAAAPGRSALTVKMHPGDLIFSPPRGRAATRTGHRNIAPGQFVLQARNGTIRAIFNNPDTGKLDTAALDKMP
jgi:hypothetical protein